MLKSSVFYLDHNNLVEFFFFFLVFKITQILDIWDITKKYHLELFIWS